MRLHADLPRRLRGESHPIELRLARAVQDRQSCDLVGRGFAKNKPGPMRFAGSRHDRP
jgi:hypothetical protein